MNTHRGKYILCIYLINFMELGMGILPLHGTIQYMIQRAMKTKDKQTKLYKPVQKRTEA